MDSIIVALVDGIVVPVTGTIPFLASSGILVAVFAVMWAVFAVLMVRDRPALDRAWHRFRRWPLLAQGVAWLLFLPVVAGLWIWHQGWPAVARGALIAGIACWNLLVLMPTVA